MNNKKKVFGTLIIACIAVLFVIIAVSRCTDVTSLNNEAVYENNAGTNEAKKQTDYFF